MKKSIYFILIFTFCISIVARAQVISTIAGNMMVGYSGDGGPGIDAVLNDPMGIASDAFGNVYFGDTRNYCVRKIDSSGIITTVAGNGSYGYSGDYLPATSVALFYPQSVAVDTSGDLYICDNGFRIRKLSVATGILTTVAGNGLYGFSGDGGLATRATLGNTTSVAVDNKGNIYISDYANQRVRKVDASGIITTIAGDGSITFHGDHGPATSAGFQEIYGLAADNFGNIYVADPNSECIRKIDNAGIITTVAGNQFGSGAFGGGFSGDNGPATDAELNYAKYIAVDNIGDLYIADNGNHRIRKVNMQTGIITIVAGDGIPGYNGDGISPTASELYNPNGVCVDKNSKIYIVDKNNNRIRSINSTVFVQETNKQNGNLSIFPNPANEEINIKMDKKQVYSMTIMNCLGQVFIQREINSIHVQVNIKEIPKGLYYVALSNFSGTVFRQFVKM